MTSDRVDLHGGGVKRSKKDLVAALGLLGREMSTRTVLFHEAAASRVGLGVTDYKCLDYVQRATEPMHAGKLAELTGLTTGAITGVLDRLERAGFVRREKDPNDRRQVVVRLVPAVVDAYAREIFEPFGAAWEELSNRYSVDELELIERHFAESIALLERETARVRGITPTTEAVEATNDGAELGGIKRGFLEFLRGASGYEIVTAPGRFLYRAEFEGTAPKIQTKAGHVSVKAGGGIFDWRRSGGRFTLTDAIPWRFVVHGGISRSSVRTGDITPEEVTIHGGMNEVEIQLGRPEGPVAVRVHGGASRVTFSYPKGTAVRIEIHGGVHKLTTDMLELGSADGVIRWESPGFGRAERGFDFAIHGGASELSIRTAA